MIKDQQRVFRLPYQKELTSRAREFRKNMTPGEEKIWNEVLSKKRLLGLRWLRQRPIDHFIVDFYCPEIKLVIEIDGGIHNKKIYSDAERSSILAGYGLRIVRFTEEEVLAHLPDVRQRLADCLAEIGLPLRNNR